MYSVLADSCLLIHTFFIAFVVLGFVLIVVGIGRSWSWIENFWFRLSHLLAIVSVAVMAWLGKLCPLTILESRLREAADEAAYPASFVQYWMQRLIYYDIPLWVFSIVYTAFAILVMITWIVRPPRWSLNDRQDLK